MSDFSSLFHPLDALPSHEQRLSVLCAKLPAMSSAGELIIRRAGDFHAAPPANTGVHGDRRGSGLAPLAVPPYGQGMGGHGMGMPNSAGLPDNGEQPPAW